ncbi:SH3 domain-containing protein [Roseibium aggregatum]|uniref:SH3 domain-containing protein n=1 Tax=Roseibium aggregatum TaxID=187304 RepID=UPI0016808155|nr:SH3 domain-containing protein [Roseibium aggregatum]
MIPTRHLIAAFLIFGALSLTGSLAQAAERKALPVDQASKVQGFEAYRSDLLAAIARRDVEAVVAAASQDIELSFGGDAGPDALRSFLTLSEDDLADEYKDQADAMREGYWDALEEVLRLGGKADGPDAFDAPYTWTVELGENDDPFTTYFVIDRDVPMRDRPNRHGAVTKTLAYDIVEAIDGGEGTSFQKVRLATGETGFVDKAHLRSAVDYRARFERRPEGWKMVFFLAGD